MPAFQTSLVRALRLAAALAIVCALLAIEFQFHGLRNTTVTYSLLLAILFFAVQWDRLETIAASVVASMGLLYYFQPPVGSFKARDPQSYVAVAGFLITARFSNFQTDSLHQKGTRRRSPIRAAWMTSS
jgi:K+-sensing histidine kinase KdpD